MANYGTGIYGSATYGQPIVVFSVYGQAVYGTAVYGTGEPPPTEGPSYGSGSYGGGTYGHLELFTGEPPVDPPPPTDPGPDFFPAFDIFQPERIWRFILADSNTMENIGEIRAPNVSLDLALNRAGSCNFTIPQDDDLAGQIENVTTCVKAYRRDVPIWSGMVWNCEDVLEEQKSLQVSAVGWFEQLNHRKLRYEKKYQNNTFTGGQIALDLVNIANNQKDGLISTANPDGTGTIWPTFLVLGLSSDTQLRNMSYERWQNIGQAIIDLSNIENGYDFKIDPISRIINIYTSAIGSPVRKLRPESQFGYNWGPNNLRTFRRQLDTSSLVTQFHAVGRFATATAAAGNVSSGPMAKYGLWEDHQALSEVVDLNVLSAFANGEVATRSVPRVIYSMNPFPWSPNDGRVPEPFVDYDIGDHVYFTAKYLPRINIQRQAVRVFGIKLSIDSEGNENIDDLQLSPTN